MKEYIIKIENELITQNLTEIKSGPSPSSNNQVQTKEKLKVDAVSKIIAVNAVKQAIGFGISNYQNLTGDSLGQANLNGALELGGLIAMGLTGPVGIAAAIGSVGMKVANRAIDVEKSRVTSRLMMERVGMSQVKSR